MKRNFTALRTLLVWALWVVFAHTSAHAQLSEDAANPAVRGALQAYEAGNFKLAQRRFTALARQGLAVGQFNLAMMHLRQELKPASVREAERLLLAAGNQGFVRAEHALGQFYELGLGGKPDLARGFKWNALAAEHGHPDALLDHATAHYLGRGTPVNKAEAAKWYRAVAQTGDEGAQYLLASMYEAGDGVPQDLRLALYWYQIAAQNGDIAASFKAKEVQQRIDAPAKPPAAGAALGAPDVVRL